MIKETTEFSNLLQNRRIGLIACGDLVSCRNIEADISNALAGAQASFEHVDANTVSPADKELERYHALVVHFGNNAAESNWFPSELVRANSRPLLLVGAPEAVYRQISLQYHADDTIFAPFAPEELIFRLSMLVLGTRSRQPAAPRSAKPCVLVADDDRDIVLYLKNVLRNFDVDAHFVSDGRAALAAARRLLPDLLMLDVRMPLMNGIEVLRSLRSDPGTRSLVTMLLTASTDPLHIESGADLGAVGYILKPLGHLDLIRKLKPILKNPALATVE